MKEKLEVESKIQEAAEIYMISIAPAYTHVYAVNLRGQQIPFSTFLGMMVEVYC